MTRRAWLIGPPSQEEAEGAIDEAARRLVEAFHPLRILLFGSRATGKAGVWSDIDLLVVMPDVSDKRRLAVQMRRALSDLPLPKDVVVTTPEEIERRGHLAGSILGPALGEGKLLYAAS